MEINIYHIIEDNLVTSVIKLLNKVYSSGCRCLFFSPLKERIDVINNSLWTFSTNAFIPHGTKSMGFKELQPIYLTDEYENPNNATVLLMMDTFDYTKFNHNFEKIMLVFADINKVDEAYKIYQDLKNENKIVNYWKQMTKSWKKL